MQEKAEATPTIHVGIDVSKAHLDVHLHPLGERLRVTNDAHGHRHLVALLTQHAVALVLMEPTSRYHRAVHRRLHEAGLPVALANPLRARLFAQASGTLAKTDAIDAAMLARMAERLGPDPVAPPTPAQEELQELASARQAAIAERTALGNRLAAATSAFLRRELATRLRTLERHIARLDSTIDAMIRADHELDRKARILRSIPGVGPVTSLAFLAQLGGLRRCGAAIARAPLIRLRREPGCQSVAGTAWIAAPPPSHIPINREVR